MAAGPVFTHTVTIDGTDIAGIVLAGSTITTGRQSDTETPGPAVAYLELVTADADPDVSIDLPEFSYNAGIPSGFRDDYRDVYEGGETRLASGTSRNDRRRVAVRFPRRLPRRLRRRIQRPTLHRACNRDRLRAAADRPLGCRRRRALDPGPYRRLVVAGRGRARPRRPDRDRGRRHDHDRRHVLDAITATDADAAERSPWAVLVELAESCNAVVYCDRDGVLTYRTRTATPADVVDLPAASTMRDSLRMTQELGRIVNRVTVEYGAPVSGVRPTVTVDDVTSQAEYGIRAAQSTYVTVLEDLTDATDYGQRILDATAALRWIVPSVDVNMRLAELDETLGEGQLEQLVELDINGPARMLVLPPAAPLLAHSSRVIGYTERLDRYAWTITYALDPAGWTMEASA
jgi:hypothetical protein